MLLHVPADMSDWTHVENARLDRRLQGIPTRTYRAITAAYAVVYSQ